MAQDYNRWFDVKLQPGRLLWFEGCLSVEKPISKRFSLELTEGFKPRSTSIPDGFGGIWTSHFSDVTYNKTIVSFKVFSTTEIEKSFSKDFFDWLTWPNRGYVSLNYFYKSYDARFGDSVGLTDGDYWDNYHRYENELSIKFGFVNYFHGFAYEPFIGFGFRSSKVSYHMYKRWDGGDISDVDYNIHSKKWSDPTFSFSFGFKLGYHFKY